ncbi:hypothetical protein MHBO_002293 [Bonamia ostreae]
MSTIATELNVKNGRRVSNLRSKKPISFRKNGLLFRKMAEYLCFPLFPLNFFCFFSKTTNSVLLFEKFRTFDNKKCRLKSIKIDIEDVEMVYNAKIRFETTMSEFVFKKWRLFCVLLMWWLVFFVSIGVLVFSFIFAYFADSGFCAKIARFLNFPFNVVSRESDERVVWNEDIIERKREEFPVEEGSDEHCFNQNLRKRGYSRG